jgi:hypothetical protein
VEGNGLHGTETLYQAFFLFFGEAILQTQTSTTTALACFMPSAFVPDFQPLHQQILIIITIHAEVLNY